MRKTRIKFPGAFTLGRADDLVRLDARIPYSNFRSHFESDQLANSGGSSIHIKK